MIRYRAFLTKRLSAAVLAALVLLPLVGCDDDTVSPCHDCGPIPQGTAYTDVTERTFTADDAAIVRVVNFTGKVTYRTGDAGTIRVIATKRTARRSHLDHLEVEMIAHEGGLDIEAANPLNLKKASVDFEITAPADAIPQIDTAVGEIGYRGHPRGSYRFKVGVGSIRLRLGSDVHITVDLHVAVGSISLGIPVDGVGSTHPGQVRGRIGSGDEGDICASVAVGSIYLSR